MNKSFVKWALTAVATVAMAASVSAQKAELVLSGLQFVDQLKAGMIEQDVFVEKQRGSGKVFRVTKENMAQFKNAKLDSTADSVHHAPFDGQKVGPYEKGQALGFTLGDWLSASGSASYSCNAGTGKLSASFKNLVSNGVYTMWYAVAAGPHMGCPNCPFATLDMPVGKADGTQNIFRADGNGGAKFSASFKPCLQLATGQLVALLAIAYHSDGKTYGPGPGPVGSVAHIQLLTILPGEGAWAVAGK